MSLSSAHRSPTTSAIVPTWLSREWLWPMRAAWVCLAAVVLAILVVGLTAAFEQPEQQAAAPLVASGFALALAFMSVAALLMWRRSNDPMALFAATTLLLFGGLTWPGSGEIVAQLNPHLRAPILVLNFLGGACFSILLYVFPDGRLVPRWTRWTLGVWLVGQALDHLVRQSAPDARQAILIGITLTWVVGLAGGIFAQVYRFRRVSSVSQRQQTKWTMLGFVCALTAILVVLPLSALAPALQQDAVAILWLQSILNAAMALVPISIGVAILRYRLFDIDLLLGRALVYGGLTAGVVAIYALVVGSLGVVFRTGDNLLLALVATGAAAVLFQPLRQRLQRGVNRLLYGQRDEPYAVLSRLGQRLESSIAPDEVLPTIVETVRTALKLPYAAISLPRDGVLVPVAASGDPVSQPVRLPLLWRGEPVGELVLGQRSTTEELTAADRRLLEDLARSAGTAAYAFRLTADLQRSRERLVSAREEERRRIRRDLHDGLGPTLAALTLKLETARNKLADDPDAAALLGDLAERTQGAIVDVRRLVYQLRPPALDERGLVGAVRQAASAYESAGGDGLQIRVEAPDSLPTLPAAVEVAAYRIAQEALTNVVRHAHARTCRIVIACVSDALQVVVEDDGTGLPSTPRTGVGLGSMRERAAELGGSCTVEARSAGGTRVEACLPLEST